MDASFEKEPLETSSTMFNPVTFVLSFLSSYGWHLTGVTVLLLYTLHKLRPHLQRWRQAKEDARYHKDPDAALARMEGMQRAREEQQRRLQADSERALQLQKEREEKKRQENLERLQKYGAVGGNRLGGAGEHEYMPLSGGASTSTYRPPKKSKCGGGGCGR